ncbi:site-specific integrase [Aureispira anguillae]|uniref:Site-specific integrase n=1 Tax=Aureispira anguillae TaxID=2864201 RepID=A0A915YD90_9BACT|nr:site-specific integrase [Aureispira anguillae]BDS10935.1 site-specific integrase [Aureispira anguillae]
MIQFTISHNFKNRLKKDGTAPVQIRAYHNKARKYIPTGIFVTPAQWSKKYNKVIDHPNALQYNAEIRRQLDELEAYALEWIKKHGAMTLEQLDSYFNYGNVQSFTEFWEYELAQDTKLEKITKKKHRTALNYWKGFQKDVKFSELTYSLIHDFDTYLYAHKLHVNTVYTHHKQVKKYINLAIRKDLLDSNKNPYLKFKAKTVPTERLVLSEEEVKKIEALTFREEESYLDLIRDMFLFSCYTGLRFSDTCAISYEDINHSEEGMVLNIVAKKTSKQLLLPLYKLYECKPEAIINKYRAEVLYDRGLVFHKYSNQYFNRALKKLAKRAGIQKAITSHVARHTFATNLASKVPIHILKAILQHSKIETTMVYLHLSNKLVNDALDKVDW